MFNLWQLLFVPSRSRRRITLLLCLLSWRGPVPVVHEHEIGTRTHSGDAALDRHLQTWHANSGQDIARGLAAASHASSEWHFHLILPWNLPLFPDEDSQPGGPSSDDPLQRALVQRTSDGPTRQGDVGGYLHEPVCSIWAWDDLVLTEAEITIQPDRGPPGGYVTTLLLNPRPLATITGVALC